MPKTQSFRVSCPYVANAGLAVYPAVVDMLFVGLLALWLVNLPDQPRLSSSSTRTALSPSPPPLPVAPSAQ